MTTADGDKVFARSISKLYDAHLVPTILDPSAAGVANWLASRALREGVAIGATDLNSPMQGLDDDLICLARSPSTCR